jgi:hypothetical protein
MRLLRPLAVALLCCPCALVAQSAPARAPAPPVGAARALTISRAVRTHDAIKLDGRLDEPAWSTAPVTDAFTQMDPDEGKPASQRTEVRVLYDDAALYVSVRLHDTGLIVGRLGRRDMPLGDSDWFLLMIDSYHDLRTAFGFDVNPAGVKRDEIKTIAGDDNSWDAVWDAATSVDSAGWTVEYRIPFSQLGFSNAAMQVWGIEFERVIGRNTEYAVSTFTPKSEQGGVPRFGQLVGLRDIHQGNRLELLPYTVAKASSVDPGTNVLQPAHERTISAGLDLRYRVTSNATLNAAFNPDFGQVEVDPAVVNLGVYETFFAEKRPFFVEGSEIFDFGAAGTSGGQLFYSRRIGRAPSLSAPSSISVAPDATTILGAAKLSGKSAGWSFGLLDAVTDREVATYRTPTGADARVAVEPLANNLSIRARRELRGGQSMIGGALTAVNRSLDTPEFEASLHRAAYATGLDFRHEWGNRQWYAHGDAEVSHVEGSTSAILATQRRSNHYFQRPDATHLPLDSAATSLTGYSVNAALGKQAGRHWRGEVAAALTSPTYEVNDLGFSYRTDRRDGQASLTYVENKPGPRIRQWTVTSTMRSEHNFAWQPILTVGTVTAQATTASYWAVAATGQRYFTALDDRLTRGGPIALRPAWWATNLRVQSDGRKPVTIGFTGGTDDHDFGAWDWNAGVNIGIKTSSRWNLTIGPALAKAFTPAQFVTSVSDASFTPMYGRRYVFAPLHQTQLGIETRLNVTFTPRLSLETYMQPLLSSGDYGDVKQLLAPKSFDFGSYTAPVPNLDFNLRSLRGNAVLRWEWRAGSTMYVAWQQRRSDYAPIGDFEFGRDSRALLDARPDNILLVKVNYWFTP